jgi:hypothetical protein
VAGYATADGEWFRIPEELWSHAGLEGETSNDQGDLLLYRRSEFARQFTEMKQKVVDDQKLLYILGPAGAGKSCCAFAFATSQEVSAQRKITWIHVRFNGVCKVVEFERGKKTCWSLNVSNYQQLSVLTSILDRRKDEKEHIVFCDGYTVVHTSLLAELSLWRDRDRENHRLAFITCMHSRRARLKDDCKSVDNVAEIFIYSWEEKEYKAALQNSEFLGCVCKNLDAHLVGRVGDPTGPENNEWGVCTVKADATTIRLDEMVGAKYRLAGMSCRYMFGHGAELVKTEILKSSAELEDPIPYLNGGIGENAKPTVSGLFAKLPNSPGFALVSTFAAASVAMHVGPDCLRNLAKRYKIHLSMAIC